MQTYSNSDLAIVPSIYPDDNEHLPVRAIDKQINFIDTIDEETERGMQNLKEFQRQIAYVGAKLDYYS